MGAPAAGLPRRSFLTAAIATGAVVAAGGVLGPALRRRQNVEAARDAVAEQLAAQGPPPPATAPTGVLDADVPGVSRFITPNDDFYRIDTALVVPQVDPDSWSLEVDGDGRPPRSSSTFDDLLAMDQVEEIVTIACVSNEVGGDLVGNARWAGVLLARPARPRRRAGGRDADRRAGPSTAGRRGSPPSSPSTDDRPSWRSA